MERITTEENLYEAWRRVRTNHGGPGVDSVRLADFEEDLPGQLAALSVQLQDESYVPLPLRYASLPKKDGGERALMIPTVADRVAQRAFVNALEPIFEPLFLPCSFGYRPGRGVPDAVERVLAYRASGLEWVLDADVKDFFPSVDHALLMSQLREHLTDRAVLRTIGLWLEAGAMEAPDEPRPSLLSLAAAQVRGAMQVATSGEKDTADWEADSWEKTQRSAALKRFGSEAARLAWDYRKTILPLLVSKGALAFGGVGALVVGGVVAADYALSKRGPRRTGTPQGGPISPLLSNVYLHPFDEQLTRQGLRLVRYADDFVVCCPSEARAKAAQRTANNELTRLRLTLHPQKTRILSCADPLRFLGHEFDEDGAFQIERDGTPRKLLEQAKSGGKAMAGRSEERRVGTECA